MVYSINSIYPLKIKGEGALIKTKRRKIYLDIVIDDNIDSCRPSTVERFDYILSETRKIKDLLSGLPTGWGWLILFTTLILHRLFMSDY